MQDAFLKAFLSIDSYKDDTSFGSWLKRIVIHTCIDQLKKKHLETVSLENYPLEIMEDQNNKIINDCNSKIFTYNLSNTFNQFNLKTDYTKLFFTT